MKKLMTLLTVVFLVTFFTACGDGKMDSAKAHKLIVEEMKTLIMEVAEENKDQKEIVEKINENLEKLADTIIVNDVREEGESAIARFNMVQDGTKGPEMEVKFQKSDSGWKLEELKSPMGGWIPFSDFFKKSFASAINEGKKVTTMQDIKNLGMAIESYMIDEGKAPEAASILEMGKLLSPFHIKEVPTKDAWGNELFYKYQGELYQIRSAGTDGRLAEYTTLDDDIVYQNGEFVTSQFKLDELLEGWK